MTLATGLKRMKASSHAVVFLNQALPAGVELAAADSGQGPPRTTTRPPRAISRKIWMRLARVALRARIPKRPDSGIVSAPRTTRWPKLPPLGVAALRIAEEKA